jgi:hypothetical protein
MESLRLHPGASSEGWELAVIDTLLAAFPVVVELPVAWGDMDSYRHVSNVVYFRYLENARLEYFRRLPRMLGSTAPDPPRRARWCLAPAARSGAPAASRR